jgi:basic membrane lipoprotein Med (substrate-binding protein (PBP1-ABC) superfamily)
MKKMSVVISILIAAVMLLSACGPAAAPAATKIKVGEVTDMGGVNDNSFNVPGIQPAV